MKFDIRPEEKLLSAVIAFAVEEICLRPIRVETPPELHKYFKNKKIVLMRHDAKTAYEFLFKGGCDGYCAALNMDPTEFKRRLVYQITDLHTTKPFDVSRRNKDQIGRFKRMFKLNHKLYHEGRIEQVKEEEYDDAD